MTKAKKTGSGESSPRRHGITVITEPTEEELAERQISDYRGHREKFIKWVLNFGKDPERGEGYAEATADIRCARVDKFYRWVWEQEDGYTTRISHEHADTYYLPLCSRPVRRKGVREVAPHVLSCRFTVPNPIIYTMTIGGPSQSCTSLYRILRKIDIVFGDRIQSC